MFDKKLIMLQINFYKIFLNIIILAFSVSLSYAFETSSVNTKTTVPIANCLSNKKDDSFFSGLTVSERFQKLRDGSFEKYYAQNHDAIKKERYVGNRSNASPSCAKGFNDINTNGMSVSEKFQMLRDGSLERKVFGQ